MYWETWITRKLKINIFLSVISTSLICLVLELVPDELVVYVSGLYELLQFVSGIFDLWYALMYWETWITRTVKINILWSVITTSLQCLVPQLVLDKLVQYVSGLDELVQSVSGAMCLWEDKFTLSTSRHIACYIFCPRYCRLLRIYPALSFST